MISPAGDEEPQTTTTNKMAGRPEGTTGITLTNSNANLKDIQKTIQKIEVTKSSIEKQLKKKLSIKKFNEQQNEIIQKLCEAVVTSSELKTWEEVATSCVNNFEEISALTTKPEILSLASQHEITDDYSAAILYHSQKINEN